jgi:hypothetical protein
MANIKDLGAGEDDKGSGAQNNFVFDPKGNAKMAKRTGAQARAARRGMTLEEREIAAQAARAAVDTASEQGRPLPSVVREEAPRRLSSAPRSNEVEDEPLMPSIVKRAEEAVAENRSAPRGGGRNVLRLTPDLDDGTVKSAFPPGHPAYTPPIDPTTAPHEFDLSKVIVDNQHQRKMATVDGIEIELAEGDDGTELDEGEDDGGYGVDEPDDADYPDEVDDNATGVPADFTDESDADVAETVDMEQTAEAPIGAVSLSEMIDSLTHVGGEPFVLGDNEQTQTFMMGDRIRYRHPLTGEAVTLAVTAISWDEAEGLDVRWQHVDGDDD